MMTFDDEEFELFDTLCVGCVNCELPLPVNDLGLCVDCNEMLERDLNRSREWQYGFLYPPSKREGEELRNRVIQRFGAAYEILEEPKKPAKNKSARSRETKRKREIAAKAIRDYDTDDVFAEAHRFIHGTGDEWVNFSRVSQHLHDRFYKLKPRHMGYPGKRYKSLVKLLQDYPEQFEFRKDDKILWIRSLK